ncbi:MAG: HAD-IA family hydrolase [Myxococcota bacterium]|nr:HAD-IA family hydrolase [Myxococcota bacterium]
MNISRNVLICFDLGGVLIRIRKNFSELLVKSGVRFFEEEFNPQYLNSWIEIHQAYQLGRCHFDEYLDSLSKVEGCLWSREELVRLHDAIIDREYAGVFGTVRTLRENGIPLALLSNTCSRHWPILEKFPAIRLIPQSYRYASFQLGLIKPDQKIYRRVQKMSGYQKIIFFDDHLENIRQARTCGWDAVHIQNQFAPHIEIECSLRRRSIL